MAKRSMQNPKVPFTANCTVSSLPFYELKIHISFAIYIIETTGGRDVWCFGVVQVVLINQRVV